MPRQGTPDGVVKWRGRPASLVQAAMLEGGMSQIATVFNLNPEISTWEEALASWW
jgi:hypothetical protein